MMRGQTTLYDVLGVSNTASDKEIRAAFRRLALQHHPDRFAGSQRAAAEQRFQAITEAFNVLSNPETRDKYDKEMSKGGKSEAMDPKEIARRLAALGAQAYRESNLSEAMDNLRAAINHDADCGRAHYFLGIILARISGREREGLRHLEKATTLEPNNAVIIAEAAALFLASGMKSRARRFAADALKLDPDNSKAKEVFEQIEGQQKTQNEGLLGRFMRKG